MSENNLKQLIQTGTPQQIIKNEQVAKKFMHIYAVVNGIKDPARANAFYEAEMFHFLKIVNDSSNIASCTKLSLYGIFMDVAVSGLSFDPSMKHLYIVPFKTNVGTKDNPKWEKRAALQISGYGELLLRQLQGQIKYADNPVIVYEGDEFKYGSKNGSVVLEHMAVLPRKSQNMVACYIKITRHDDTVDYKVMTFDELMSLKKFSKEPNSLAWNAGIAGMFQAKAIKHAFKNYPKLRTGNFTKLESETIDTPITEEETEINYDIEDMSTTEVIAQDTAAMQPPPQEKPKPQPETVVFTEDDDF